MSNTLLRALSRVVLAVQPAGHAHHQRQCWRAAGDPLLTPAAAPSPEPNTSLHTRD